MNRLNKLLWKITNHFISFYQHTLSPDKWVFSPILKGRVCAHEPHCSAYGKECMKRYGFWPGVAYTTHRVISCTPSRMKKYDPSHYRVVFFSGSPIGVPFLEHLAQDTRFEVVWVVTMPDKATGRGHEIKKNVIKEAAEKLSIKSIFDWAKIKQKSEDGTFLTESQVAASLQDLQADYFVVVAYGKIIPVDMLNIPTFWSINVHGSILPAYRGASPLQTVFLDNRKETGITVMRMSEWMDEWDIVSTYQFKLPFYRTAKDLFEKVMSAWPKVLADALWDLGKWHIESKPQENTKATYCGKIEKEDGKIDLWSTPLSEVYNKYRAYALWPKTWTVWTEDYPKIAEKTLVIEDLICDEDIFHNHADAPIIGEWVQLNPAVSSIFIKPEGKKAMPWSDFVNGYLR